MKQETKINVLHYVPFIHTENGIVKVILNFWNNLDHEKFQFDILHHNWRLNKYDKINKDFENLLIDSGINVYSICDVRPSLKQHYNDLEQFYVESKGKYDIVHAHSYIAGAIFIKMAKKYGIKHRIYHSHSSKSSDLLLHRIRNSIILKFGVGNATARFACSEESGKCMFGNKSFTIIENAINVNDFVFDNKANKMIRRELGFKDDVFVIGSVGRLTVEKNYEFLIYVFNEVCKLNKNSILIIVGRGNQKDKLFLTAKKLNLNEKIIILDEYCRINKLYSVFDVFALTSLYEGFPLVAVEAQAAGLPCFLSETITKKVILSNKMKLLAINNNYKEWAKFIYAQRNNKDRSLPDGVYNSNYNSKVFANKLQTLYLKMVVGDEE